MNYEKDDLILKVEDVSKKYAGVLALDKVSLNVRYGEIHAIVGENGAGKSTLMKIINGIIEKNSGRILFRGREVHFQKPCEAITAGISVVHQDLSLIPSLNFLMNIFMDRMPSKYGFIKIEELEIKAKQVLDMVGLDVDIHTRVKDLSLSQC